LPYFKFKILNQFFSSFCFFLEPFGVFGLLLFLGCLSCLASFFGLWLFALTAFYDFSSNDVFAYSSTFSDGCAFSFCGLLPFSTSDFWDAFLSLYVSFFSLGGVLASASF
jgi:hypothetical protein